jgi:hypothetical protein
VGSVAISGGAPGCALDTTATGFSSAVPSGLPANASTPAGMFRFRSTGCAGNTLTVRITYPHALPAGVQLMKYGPAGAGAASSWYPMAGATLSADRLTVAYAITDNGMGDGNTADAGVIEDPFAPVLLAAIPGTSGPASIPTLSEWGLILLSLMAAGLGMHQMRRSSAFRSRACGRGA